MKIKSIKSAKSLKNKTVLDLGCGQGRDALTLAKLGYTVTGVDVSKVGINQMMEQVKKDNLAVHGIIADIYHYKIDEKYDIILLDSILHFYKKEKKKETNFLERIMQEMKFLGLLCIFVSKSKITEKGLEHIFRTSRITWEILVDKYINYPKLNTQYRMFITKKLQ